MRPLGTKLWLQRLQPTTSGLLHLPTSAENQTWLAKVIAVGNRVKELKAGDKVAFNDCAYLKEVQITPTERYLELPESDILAIVEE